MSFKIAPIVALVIALTLSGCGGGSSSSSVERSDSSSQTDPQSAQLKFTRCMREHGVEITDPGSSGGDSNFNAGAGGGGASMQQAQEACAHLLQGAAPSQSDAAPDSGDQQEALLAFARCMRKHGVDFPDPKTTGGVTQLSPGNDINPNDPRVREAQDACAKNLPDFDSGPPTGGPTP